MYILYRACMSVCLYEIVKTERAGDKDKDTACDVRHRAVYGEAEAYAEGSDKGSKTARIYSEIAYKTNSNYDLLGNSQNV
jgi:hypothetical protein